MEKVSIKKIVVLGLINVVEIVCALLIANLIVTTITTMPLATLLAVLVITFAVFDTRSNYKKQVLDKIMK